DCMPINPATLDIPGQATAAAYDGWGHLWVQTREPAMLQEARRVQNVVLPPPIMLSDVSRYDDGHHFFHHQSGKLIACASCHGEAGDDGHVWHLDAFPNGGPRRTQSLRDGILSRAPFHWTGDLPQLPDLVHEVFVNRMGGTEPNYFVEQAL